MSPADGSCAVLSNGLYPPRPADATESHDVRAFATCSGLIARSNQVNIPNARRSDTPPSAVGAPSGNTWGGRSLQLFLQGGKLSRWSRSLGPRGAPPGKIG